MAKLFTWIGQKIHHHAGAVIAITLVLTAFLALGMPKINFNTSNSMFVADSAKLSQDSKTYAKKFGGEAFVVNLSTQNNQSTVTKSTLAKVADFSQKAEKIAGVYTVTSVVDALNGQLKSTNMASGASSQSSRQLQAAMLQQLTTKQQAKLQQQITGSLNQAQQQQISQYTQSILTAEQKAQMTQATSQGAGGQTAASSAINQLLSPAQQTQVQNYTMGILTKTQTAALSQTVTAMLPKVQQMDTALLKQLIYSQNGKIPSALNQLLPKDGQHLLISVTLKGDAAASRNGARYDQLNQALKTSGLKSGNYHAEIAGSPAIFTDVTAQMGKSMAIMLVAAVILMIFILMLVFPVRRRLLPLLFVLVGLIWTFGIMGWLGIDLTMATMATLPIIIGLGTDFGVQFLNRYEEEFRKDHNVTAATYTTLTNTGPAVGVAVVIMALSFLTMLISKAPLIKGFGITLAIGVAASYLVELALMFATLSYRDRKAIKAKGELKASTESWLSKTLVKYTTWISKHAFPVVAIGLLLGGVGFFFESHLNVETDLIKMIPQDLPSLKRNNQLVKLVGSTTNISYLVSADDVRDKAVLNEINDFSKAEVKKYGSQIQSATSITNALKQSHLLTQSQNTLNHSIQKMPRVLTSTLISSDYKNATISFKISLKLKSDKQLKLMNQIEADAKAQHLPRAMTIAPAGSTAMMLQGIDNMTANHGLIIFAGLAIIFMALLLVYRNFKQALFPVIPIAIVLGLSPMTLSLLGISYNPVTVSLSSLILGIGTEFTILVLERFVEEQRSGRSTLHSLQQAMGR